MTDVPTRVPAPKLPHADSIRNLSICDAAGTVVAVYCPQTCAAAVFDRRAEVWMTWSAVLLGEFLDELLPKFGFAIADGPARQAWIAAIHAATRQQQALRGH